MHFGHLFFVSASAHLYLDRLTKHSHQMGPLVTVPELSVKSHARHCKCLLILGRQQLYYPKISPSTGLVQSKISQQSLA